MFYSKIGFYCDLDEKIPIPPSLLTLISQSPSNVLIGSRPSLPGILLLGGGHPREWARVVHLRRETAPDRKSVV